MALERMELYIEEHPDALEHIVANCTLFDEELIEFLNAKASLAACWNSLHMFLTYIQPARFRLGAGLIRARQTSTLSTTRRPWAT